MNHDKEHANENSQQPCKTQAALPKDWLEKVFLHIFKTSIHLFWVRTSFESQIHTEYT